MLNVLIEQFEKNREAISAWVTKKQIEAGVHPFYASSDLRNTGFKLGIVDTNLYPAGFNNMCKKFMRDAVPIVKNYFAQYFPQAKRIGIFTEEHTRNTFYLENVKALQETVMAAGFEVVIISTFDELLRSHSNFDAIIVNNDFSAGLPPEISNITTPLLPPPQAGWHTRRKSTHFEKLRPIIEELAAVMQVDPWLLTAETREISNIDITDKQSRAALATAAEAFLKDLTEKYKKYGITETPYLFMKDDAGTYGMGITTISSADEILAFNKKRRDTFKYGKNKKPITSVIFQEGLTSSERIHGMVSEPVVYMINHHAIGGFFRMHESADERSSLNRPGMKFTKLCFHELEEYHNTLVPHCNVSCLESLYFTLGVCASLASAEEIKDILKK